MAKILCTTTGKLTLGQLGGCEICNRSGKRGHSTICTICYHGVIDPYVATYLEGGGEKRVERRASPSPQPPSGTGQITGPGAVV